MVPELRLSVFQNRIVVCCSNLQNVNIFVIPWVADAPSIFIYFHLPTTLKFTSVSLLQTHIIQLAPQHLHFDASWISD